MLIEVTTQHKYSVLTNKQKTILSYTCENNISVELARPSIRCLALLIAKVRSRRSTNPTRYCDSMETTTGNPL